MPSQNDLLRYEAQVRELISQMTLEEKAGQMCQPDQAFLSHPSDVSRYGLGALLSGGGSGPKDSTANHFEGWRRMVENYRAQAGETRLRIPLLYGVDAVHGHNNVPGAVIFPHNIGLGCTRDPELVREISEATARDALATGINWIFAPCVAVPQDDRWGRTYEGYSDDPELVSRLAEAAVIGIQGEQFPLRALACAKHFVADGGTVIGSAREFDERGIDGGLDQGDARCTEEELRAIHLPGYVAAVRAGVGSVMTSYSSWNSQKCTCARMLVTDLLKTELGFQGFVVSDYNAIDQLDPSYKRCIELTINAGVDMVMLTHRYGQFCRELCELVDEGRVPVSRVDDAVVRILRIKFAAGLFDCSGGTANPARVFGMAENRSLARKAVRESIVLLKNDSQLLPLSRTLKRVHLCGQGADSAGMQCGGWTIDWHGSAAHVIPGATSILEAVRAAVSPDSVVTCTEDGSGAEGDCVAIAVIGEQPYAEFKGDRFELNICEADMALLTRLQSRGVPTVAILISGRPLLLGKLTELVTALLAVWLPGSEGGGIADILFGDFRPTGKLSRAWPLVLEQHPGASKHENLQYPAGFGLTYE